MRKDIDKLLYDGHSGHRGKKKGKNYFASKIRRKPIEEDEVGGISKSFHNWKAYRKNINTAPLLSFLNKAMREGRLWNDVYSEICESSNFSSKEFSARDCCKWFVVTGVSIIDGEPIGEYGRYLHGKFWVHPDTNILMPNKTWPKYKRDELKTNFLEYDGEFYGLKDGFWFHLYWDGKEKPYDKWKIVTKSGELMGYSDEDPNLPRFIGNLNTGIVKRTNSFKNLMCIKPNEKYCANFTIWNIPNKNGKNGQHLEYRQVDTKLQVLLTEIYNGKYESKASL